MKKPKPKVTLRRFLKQSYYTVEKITGAVTIEHRSGIDGVLRVGDQIQEMTANDLTSTCEVITLASK